jgi:hypothetical protein
MDYRNEHGLIAVHTLDGEVQRTGTLWDTPVTLLTIAVEVSRDLSVHTEERAIEGQFGKGRGDWHLTADVLVKGKTVTLHYSPLDVGRIQCYEDHKGSVWLLAECIKEDRDIAISVMQEQLSELVNKRIAHYRNLHAQVLTRLGDPLDPPPAKRPKRAPR